jgi:hypothetical protein
MIEIPGGQVLSNQGSITSMIVAFKNRVAASIKTVNKDRYCTVSRKKFLR